MLISKAEMLLIILKGFLKSQEKETEKLDPWKSKWDASLIHKLPLDNLDKKPSVNYIEIKKETVPHKI